MQLKLTVEYEGTRYQGWQVQPGGPTVQEVLERALATALREPVRVRGAGRTDAGVHACGQVAAVRVRHVPPDLERLRRSLNALTPDDVAVRDIAVVDDAFDPRRHARGRGERSPSSMRDILESRDRTQAGPTAPPHGLLLVAVRY